MGRLLRPSQVPVRPIPDVLRGPSQPLAAPVREEMEARLGADFSGVRLHTGGAARASATGVGARAYTSGCHVVIGDGGADKHTLAHELTHVIQQRQGPVPGTGHAGGFKVSDPFDAYEKAAEANAAQVMRTPLSQHRSAADGTGEQRTPAVHPAGGGEPALQRALDHNEVANPPDYHMNPEVVSGRRRAKVFGMLTDGTLKGTSPTKTSAGDPSGYDYIRSLGMTNSWIRFHLVSEKAGGPGEPRNLVPAQQSDNSRYERTFEANLKSDVENIRKGPVPPADRVYYGVEVTYAGAAAAGVTLAQANAAPFFPDHLDVYHQYYDSARNVWEWRSVGGVAGVRFTFNVAQPHDIRASLALSALTLPVLKQYTGVAPGENTWVPDDVTFLTSIATGGARHTEFLGYLPATPPYSLEAIHKAFDRIPFNPTVRAPGKRPVSARGITFDQRITQLEAGEIALDALCRSIATGVLIL